MARAAADQRKHLTGLSAARFLAALHILAFHYGFLVEGQPEILRRVFLTGSSSTSFFFLLSGFLLAYHYTRGETQGSLGTASFWVSRWARIWPTHMVAWCIALPFTAAQLDGVFDWLARLVVAATLMQAWLPSLAYSVNPPAWSISAIAFFYLAFPVLSSTLRYARHWSGIAVFGSVWLLGLLPAFLFTLVDPATYPWETVLYRMPLLRLPEFVLGMVAALFFLEPESSTRYSRALLAVSLGGIGVGLFLSPIIPTPFLHNGLLAPFHAGLLVSLARVPSSAVSPLVQRTVKRLGDASLPLCLIQMPLYWWLVALGWDTLPLSGATRLLLFAALSIAASLALSALLVPVSRRDSGARPAMQADRQPQAAPGIPQSRRWAI